MVRASDLVPNPGNWRRHPKAQADALRGLLSEIGYADALLARETPQGLILIDGHLRAELTPDTKVPVLIVDLSEQEAPTCWRPSIRSARWPNAIPISSAPSSPISLRTAPR